MSASNLDAHLASCSDCARWASAAERATRLMRLDVTPVPDLADRITQDVALPARRIARHRLTLRAALAVVGVVQVVVGLPAGLGDSIGMAMSMHGAHESAAWNLAVGIAFLAAALVPRRSAGLIPLLGTFLVVLTALSIRDIAAHAVTAPRLATHARRPRSDCCCSSPSTAPSRPCHPVALPPRSAVRTTTATPTCGPLREKRLLALLAVLAGIATTGLAFAGPASAHATVVTSTPVDGSRLATAPTTVTVVFDESVGIGGVGYLHVTDSAGKRVDAGTGVPSERRRHEGQRPPAVGARRRHLHRVVPHRQRRLAPGRGQHPLRHR